MTCPSSLHSWHQEWHLAQTGYSKTCESLLNQYVVCSLATSLISQWDKGLWKINILSWTIILNTLLPFPNPSLQKLPYKRVCSLVFITFCLFYPQDMLFLLMEITQEIPGQMNFCIHNQPSRAGLNASWAGCLESWCLGGIGRGVNLLLGLSDILSARVSEWGNS